MVDHKNKVVSGVASATALTSAFIAPATAQAADNDTQSYNQQQTTQEESSVNIITKKVTRNKKKLDHLLVEADKAINTAINLRDTVQKKLELAITAEETAKERWETNFDNAIKKADKADKKQNEGKKKRASILREEAEKLIVIAEWYRQDYEIAKLQVYREQDNLQKVENSLIKLRQSKLKYMN